MIRLFAKEKRDLLAQLAWSPVLLAFDFDGTLAPIVADRDAAIMRRKTAALFRKVCSVYPVAVISGRSKRDVQARLDGARVKYIVGNHGMEPGGDLKKYENQVKLVAPHLARALRDVAGVDIENKQYSLAVHYRRARLKGSAREAIELAAAKLPRRMRVVLGKLVVNIVPAKAPNKGDALLALRDRAGASTALYVGDDVTDEDVFRIDQPGRLISVRIGASRDSAARYYLRDQAEIDDLLNRLFTLRQAGSRRG